MLKHPPGKLGLKSRILLLTVMPLLIITTILTGYLIVARQDDARQDLLVHADDSIRYLSRISEIAVFTGNLNALDNYAKASMVNENVTSVAFFDRNGDLLLFTGRNPDGYKIIPHQGLYREKKGKNWFYQMPVIESDIQVDDFSMGDVQPSEVGPEIPGWVQMVVSENKLLERQQSILMTGVLIGITGFAVLIMIALRFAKGITRPLAALSETVIRLESGQLDARVYVEAEGEVGMLVRGINRLATRVKQSSDQLHYEVEHATERLHTALRSLEQKNIELQDTSLKLVAANNAKDDFLARMSHELRTPISSVLGYCRLLSKTPLKDDQQEYIEIIKQASSLLLTTSDDILNFSRLQSEAVELENEPFDLEILLDAILAMHAYAIQTKGLELILLVEPDVPVRLKGDAFRLRQIVNNLVNNAVKFTETGYVVVSVSLLEHNSREVALEFRVKDTGIGVDKDVQGRVFEPFQQADTSTSRRYGGTGLGLVIAKKLVGLMGGEIWFDADNNSGAELVFSIKCETQDYPAPDDLHEFYPVAKKVALYDTNRLSRRAISGHLKKFGLTVSVCPETLSPAEFLSASSQQFTLLVLSLDKDHWQKKELIPFINTINEHYHGIIMVVSGLTMAAWNRLSKHIEYSGIIAHLCKPVSRTGLQNKVNGLLCAPLFGQPAAIEGAVIAPVLADSNIVVAEDNQFNRSLLVTILGHYGAVVLEAEDGMAAVELCSQSQVDVLIIDLHMPVMNGLDASREIRFVNPDIPIIALTADIITGKAEALKQAGINRVLHKPIDEPKLIKVILDLLGKTPGIPALDMPEKPLLSRLPDSAVEAEIKRLIDLLTRAAGGKDFAQVKILTHQLRGIAIARQTSGEIQEITQEIDNCLFEGNGDIDSMQALIEKLNRVICTQKKP